MANYVGRLTIDRNEFPFLPEMERREFMRAWFFQRYKPLIAPPDGDLDDRYPRFPPMSARKVLTDTFSSLASGEDIEIVSNEMDESFEAWWPIEELSDETASDEEGYLERRAADLVASSLTESDRAQIRQAEASLEKARQLTLEKLQELDDRLAGLRPKKLSGDEAPGIGHNGGPTDDWISGIGIPTDVGKSLVELDALLPEASVEVSKPSEPDRSMLARCAEKAWDVSASIAMWVVTQGKTAIENFTAEFSKALGKAAAGALGVSWLAHMLHLTSTLEQTIRAMLTHFGL